MTRLKETILSFCNFIFNLCAWIVLLLIYTPVLLVLTLFRICLNKIVTSQSRGQLEPLSPNDILLIREVPPKQSVANGGIILHVDGVIDLEWLKASFRTHFSDREKYINLYCDVVKQCGYLFKRRLDLQDMEQCFSERKGLSELSEIQRELSNWFQSPCTEGNPLWGILLMKCESNNECWIGLKGHHALFDGYSFVHILNKFCSCLEDDGKNYSTNEQEKEIAIANITTILRELQLLFTLPLTVGKYLFRNFWTRDNLPEIPLLTELEPDNMMPLGFASVPLQALKSIRRKLDVHFPSMVYSLQVGALNRVLDPSFVADSIFISTSLPVGNGVTRAKEVMNFWSGGTVKIPFGSEKSPMKRVLATDRSFVKIISGNGPYLIWKYMSWIPWLLPAFLNYSMSFSNLSLFRYRTQMSCIPQMEKRYELQGKKVLHLYHATMLRDCFPRAVLLGSSSTHADQVDFAFFGHPHLFGQDGMQSVMNCLVEEIELLVKDCELVSSE